MRTSGSMLISAESTWSPAGWVFDMTLQALQIKLRNADSDLVVRAIESEQGEWDLRNWDRHDLRTLMFAVDEVYRQFQLSGPAIVMDVRFYPGLMAQLRELREMLHCETAEPCGPSAPDANARTVS